MGKLDQSHSRKTIHRDPVMNNQGIALVAALVLMAILSVMGATVLTATSTEVAISGNYRRGVEAFYIAEAGIAEGRARLRGDSTGNPQLIEDPASAFNPQWTAYILSSSDWEISDDETFYKRQTNYVPISGNPTNATVVPNSLQRALPYWVKVKHKTEYDAEREGHRPGTPHYLDLDGNSRKHTRANPGNVIFYGYPKADSHAPEEFTSSTLVQGLFPVKQIVATAIMPGGFARITIDAVHLPAPHVLGAIYVKNGASLTGPLNVISGNDRCGKASSKPPIYSRATPVTGPASFSGAPSSPQQGPLDIPLRQVIDSLKPGATLVTTHQTGVQWGTTSSSMIVYIRSTSVPGGLSVKNMAGYGILLVEGDVNLEGPIQWNGLIVSSGKVVMNGTTGNINVAGGVWVNELFDVSGSLNIAYNSCAIETAILNKPLVIRKWEQTL